jgi:hypothetical protein
MVFPILPAAPQTPIFVVMKLPFEVNIIFARNVQLAQHTTYCEM